MPSAAPVTAPRACAARLIAHTLTPTARVVGEHHYWSAPDDGAVLRAPLDGGEPQPVFGPARDLLDVARVGDRVHALVEGGQLMWWQPDGSTGAAPADGLRAIAGHDGALYAGGPAGVLRLAGPDGQGELLVATEALVAALAVGAAAIYWLERGPTAARLRRQPHGAGADAVTLATGVDPAAAIALAAGDGGLWLAFGNLAYFIADVATAIVPVAYAMADVADLAVRDGASLVATTVGSVHALCPALDQPLALPAIDVNAEPLVCGPGDVAVLVDPLTEVCISGLGERQGTGRAWYASGHLREQRQVAPDGASVRQMFYADGSPLRLEEAAAGDASTIRLWYASGQLAAELFSSGGQDRQRRWTLEGREIPLP